MELYFSNNLQNISVLLLFLLLLFVAKPRKIVDRRDLLYALPFILFFFMFSLWMTMILFAASHNILGCREKGYSRALRILRSYMHP